MLFERIDRIYGRRDYLTRNKARHLYVTNLVIFFVSLAACLAYIRQGIRIGFVIFGTSALISIVLLQLGRLNEAVKSILYLSLIALTIGLFFGMQNGNIYFSMATIIILFLHFSEIRQTIAVSIYTGGLMSFRLYQLWTQGELSSAFIFDTILKLILFCTIAIITVRVLNSHTKEKEVFIREIHHRVKNNLQILSGFANLHRTGQGKTDERQIENFNERILMLSRIHDAIYKTETDYEVDLNGILEEIVRLTSLSHPSRKFELISCEGSAPLSIEISVPFAMIVSELLNNAVLHSSEGKEEEPIRVELKFSNNRYTLIVSDAGPGIEKRSVWSSPKTTGFTLISALTQQLKGNFYFDSTGTDSKAVLEFSDQDAFASLLN
ncbi:sensor histidine kinase [Leptospira yasudae]|uniref:histidine kinase n=1 Tax=Leptospira yasudae TaxID=2202201 RepID=A0ABX9LYG2_9LEPT|nr:sensor histidine kinase [Leptospira yasudae]MBW0435629.1 sensor histidine kinase [Leptospira yasudae]RHX77927.1 sensor histidine kinase [Leptospira yasudae]TGK23179.1 sensor histidine kinase [Leptospira yasudae]TGM00433.1 sensor histidine kinase [Leptospira yasudae]TGM95250.1 sensor histidine kinase [Leptospira yasudae]